MRDLQDLADFRYRDVHALGDLFRRWLASQFLHQLPRGADQLVDRFDHVDRDTNRTRLISNCTSNRLPNPPRGISRKLISAAVFEFVDRLHQADVAFLNQVEELQASVGVLFGDRDYQAQVGFDELALGVLGVHVALDDLALRALEFQEQHACFGLELFEFSTDGARLLLVLFPLLFAAGRVGLLLQILNLTVERAHAIHRAVHTVDQALAFVVGEAQLAHCQRHAHDGAGQVNAIAPIVAGTLLLVDCGQLFLERRDLAIQLFHRVNLAQEILQTLVDDLFGDFLFVEGDQLFNRADALLEVLAQGEEFVDHDRRTRKSFQDAVLAALDSLSNFNFAFSG